MYHSRIPLRGTASPPLRGALIVPSAPTYPDEPNLSVAITDYAQDQIGKQTGHTK